LYFDFLIHFINKLLNIKTYHGIIKDISPYNIEPNGSLKNPRTPNFFLSVYMYCIFFLIFKIRQIKQNVNVKIFKSNYNDNIWENYSASWNRLYICHLWLAH